MHSCTGLLLFPNPRFGTGRWPSTIKQSLSLSPDTGVRLVEVGVGELVVLQSDVSGLLPVDPGEVVSCRLVAAVMGQSQPNLHILRHFA